MTVEKTELMKQYFDESKNIKDDYGENSVVFMLVPFMRFTVKKKTVLQTYTK